MRRISDYPEFDVDTHMHLWTRVEQMLVELYTVQGQTCITMYSTVKTQGYRETFAHKSFLVDEKLTVVKKSLLTYLALELL